VGNGDVLDIVVHKNIRLSNVIVSDILDTTWENYRLGAVSKPNLKFNFTISNKLLIYKAILKPIWMYGIQLWGTTSNSNITILERFQSKVLRLIVNAPWYEPNSVIHKDLRIFSVKEEISRFSSLYAVRLRAHTNDLIATLTEPPTHKCLCRYWPNDLITRF
jgi:hypothetical protein